MKFDKHTPIDKLKPYIKYFVASVSEAEKKYKVLSTSGLVMGAEYKGKLTAIKR